MSAYSDLVLSHGASAYWRLNEPSGTTAADSAGSRTGTLAGTGTVLGVTGRLAGELAASFDGNGRILPSSMPSLGSAFTLEAWVKPTTSLGAEPWGILVRSVFADGDFQWTYRATTTVRLNYYSTSSSNYDTLSALPIGGWTHLAVSGGAGQFVLYVNGVAQPGQAVTISGAGAGPGAIGGFAEVGAETWGWRGSLQDVAMYPTALSAAQIAQHYTVGSTVEVSVPSAGCDHTTVWSKHLATLSAPTVESERAYLATLYGEPGGTDMSTLVSRYLQAITCGTAVAPPAAPTLSLVSPNTGTQGTMVTVTLTGTNFVTAATGVMLSGSGVSVVNIQVLSPTSLTADLAIDPGATLGARTIAVTTASGTSSTQPFTIAAASVDDSAGPLAVVQTTGKSAITGSTQVTVTFPGATAASRGILVGVASSYGAGFSTTACTDNKGNTYTRVLVSPGGINTESVTLYYCPKITGAGASHTVTIAPGVGTIDLVACAIEVKGVGAGLAIVTTIAQNGIGTVVDALAPLSSPPASLVGMSLCCISATQSFLTVSDIDALAGTWAENGEHLGIGRSAEFDSRIFTDADLGGANINSRWTGDTSGWWASGIGAFKKT
jgi:hypothetical protein